MLKGDINQSRQDPFSCLLFYGLFPLCLVEGLWKLQLRLPMRMRWELISLHPDSTPGADLGEGLALEAWGSLPAHLVTGIVAGTMAQM